MSETTFTFRVDSELKERFVALAGEHDRAGSQLLRDFMRRYVTNTAEEAAYDTWFRQQVQGALDDPRPELSSEAAERRMAKRKEGAQRKARSRPR